MKKSIRIAGIVLILIVIGLSSFIYTNLRNRHPGYSVDINIEESPENDLLVGFAAIPITPEVPDRWQDVNDDAQYNPDDGDTYTDVNGNGKFDPVWMAGFQNRRPANGIHDDLWARTMVIDDGHSRISLTVLDAIGFMYDDIIEVRKELDEDLGITYSLFASTHTHEAPDLQGLWGAGYLKSGVNPDYMQMVKDQCRKSVSMAVDSLQPASLILAEEPEALAHLLTDTRKPFVTDHGLRLIRAVNNLNGHTIGTLVAWANHPETTWNQNLMITSDFVHYVREGIEKGVYHQDSLSAEGLGGVCIYINGAIGGLMTTPPDLSVDDPLTGETYTKPSFDKARAQGHQVALTAFKTLKNAGDTVSRSGIRLIARSITLPLSNKIFRLGASLGILDRGMNGWMKLQTEISCFSIGPASFVTFPGEIYPELINGGIETPEGADFNIQPVEMPPVRELMKGKYRFVFGLTQDAVGYIIPKSEWDTQSPHIYGESESPYGEINSVGHETAPIIHEHIVRMLEEL